METAIGWCKQNRSGLEDRMRPERFNSLLSIVAGLVWEFDELKTQKLEITSRLSSNPRWCRIRSGTAES